MLFEAVTAKTKANLIWAKDGMECINIFKNNKDIDLVMMDICMPRMDGLEATRILRNIRYDVTIIAQTAYAYQNDKEMCIKAGCNDYISKPIIKEELFKLLEKYLC